MPNLMRNLIYDLQTASFNGVEFAFSTIEEKGGMERIIHSFVNSTNIVTQDVGLVPMEIKMKINFTYKINGIGSEVSYKQRRDQLVNELLKEGTGQLNHPIYGLLSAVCLPYNLNNNISNINNPDFEVTFIIITPQEDYLSIPKYVSFSNEVQAQTFFDAFSEKYNIDKFKKNIDAAKSKVNNVLNKVEDFTRGVTKIKNNINEFNNDINNFKSKIDAIIVTPALLVNSLTTTFDNIKDIVENPLDAFNVYNNLSKTYTINIIDIKKEVENGEINLNQKYAINNEEALERINNDIALSDLIDVYCFNAGLESLLEYSFESIDEIIDIKNKINEKFNAYFSRTNDTSKQEYGYTYNNTLDPSIIQLLQDLSIFFNKYFDILLLNSVNIIEIEVQNMNLYSLVYSLYGNLNYKDLILKLNQNNISNPRFMAGTFKVIKELE